MAEEMPGMQREATRNGWRALARPEWVAALAVLLGGVLLHSMNGLLLATVLPTIVAELGGEAGMDWPTPGVVASSIVAPLFTRVLRALPATPPDRTTRPRVPAGRMALICLIIAGTSSAAVVAAPLAKGGLIAFALLALVIMVGVDRRATSPLLPSDAFSLGTPTGVGLWLVLLLSVTYSPLQIYVAIFLQRLHGLDPLAAGYALARASFG